jgi:hypothetical protein
LPFGGLHLFCNHPNTTKSLLGCDSIPQWCPLGGTPIKATVNDFIDELSRAFGANRGGKWDCTSCRWKDVDPCICKSCENLVKTLSIAVPTMEDILKSIRELK